MVGRRRKGISFLMLVVISLVCCIPFPGLATSRQSEKYYTNDSVFSSERCHDGTFGNPKNFKMNFDLGQARLITGVKLKYLTPASKATDSLLTVRVRGDDGYSEYLFGLPPSPSPDWITLTFDFSSGVVVDDDVEIEFIGEEPLTSSLYLCFTNSSSGHTFVDTGAGWQAKDGVDLIAELIYEEIPELVSNAGSVSDTIETSNNMDCYHSWLFAGRKYRMNLTSTTDNVFFDLTLYEMNATVLIPATIYLEDTQSIKNKSITFTCPAGESGRYYLTVESQVAKDIGPYSILLESFEPNAPTITNYNSTSNNGTVFLNWTTVADADYYEVYRSPLEINTTDFDTLTPVYSTTKTNYTDFVRWSGNWYFGVTAMNFTTGESDISSDVRCLVNIPYLIEEFNVTAISKDVDPVETATDQFFAVTAGGGYYYAVGYIDQSYTDSEDLYIAQVDPVSGAIVNSTYLDLVFKMDRAVCIDYDAANDVIYVGGNIYDSLGKDYNYFVNKYQASHLIMEWSIVRGNSTHNQTIQALEVNQDGDKLGLALTNDGSGQLVEISTETGDQTLSKMQYSTYNFTDILYSSRTGSIYTLGNGNNTLTNRTQIMVFRFEEDGDLAKTRNITESGNDVYGNAFSMDTGGEIIFISGYRFNGTTNETQLMTSKVDRNLNFYWSEYFGTGEAFDCLAYEGGVLVTGRFWNNDTKKEELALFEYSSFQEKIFNTTWYGIQDQLLTRGYALAVSGDFMVVVGTIWNNITGDKDGFLLEYKIPVPINPIQDEIPATINNDGKIQLKWQNSQPQYLGLNFAKQNFWSSVYIDGVLVVTTRESNYNVTDLYNGTHEFYIINENINGHSNKSNVEYMQVIIYTPLPVILLSANVSETAPKVFLNWTTSLGATNYSIYYSKVQLTDINIGNYTAAVTTNNTNYSLEVDYEGGYYVIIRAVNASGPSPVSNYLQFSISFIYPKTINLPDNIWVAYLVVGLAAGVGVVFILILIRKKR